MRADYETLTLEAGDRLLLCSDGLTNMVADDELAAVLGSEDVPMLAQTLIQTANLAGGEDNITAVVIGRCDS